MTVDEFLGGAGTVNTGRAGAADVQRTSAALPATHGQNHGLGLDFQNSIPVLGGDHPVGSQTGDHGFIIHMNTPVCNHFFKFCGVFRAGQFPSQLVQTEAVVDALL